MSRVNNVMFKHMFLQEKYVEHICDNGVFTISTIETLQRDFDGVRSIFEQRPTVDDKYGMSVISSRILCLQGKR